MKQTRNLEDLLRQYDLLAAPAARDAAVTGICNDSRRARDGNLFICKGYGFKPEYLAMNLYESVQPVAGAFFPLWRKTVLYREAALERVRADGEACRREALAAAETRLKEALRGNEIIDKWVDYCMIEGEFFAVSMTGEWRTEIGKPAT